MKNNLKIKTLLLGHKKLTMSCI